MKMAVCSLVRRMAFRVSPRLPEGYRKAINAIGDRMFSHFRVNPSVDWRTSEHPDYGADDRRRTDKDTEGFVAGSRVYLDIDKPVDYEEFVAHDLGHVLDSYLGSSKGRFSDQFRGESGLKDSAKEAFAMMVNYVLIDGHSGGPAQTRMYQAVCDKLGIKNTLKPGSMVRTGKYVREEGHGTPGQADYKPTLWYWITPSGEKKLVDQKDEN